MSKTFLAKQNKAVVDYALDKSLIFGRMKGLIPLRSGPRGHDRSFCLCGQ